MVRAHNLLFGAGAALVSAAPAALDTRSSSCTFDSASAVASGKSSCSTIILSGFEVDAGTTLDLTDLNDGTKVIFEGTTTFGYEEWDGPLISVSGTDIVVEGASGHLINAGGDQWWDTEGSNGGVTKPKFFAAHKMYSSKIAGLNIKNTPIQAFSINNSEDLLVEQVTIDNSDGDEESDGDALGHNTDAFDVGDSTGITIAYATVYNQDDCLAINSGTDIVFKGGYCSGGHGLSIGSVGGRSDNTVKSVTIEDTTVVNSQNGVRIKTVYDATGSVSDITYSGITLESISKYGIVIEQDYENGSPTGTPTDGVPITGLTITDVTGTVDDDAKNIYILCADGACSDWTWSGVDITGGETDSDCENVPDSASC